MGKLDESRTVNTSDEYETPPHVIARVRAVLNGTIDLDPCANPTNNVGATRFLINSGLMAPWRELGRTVFMNCPYGPQLPDWVAKVCEEAERGCEIITLTPARLDTVWYDALVSDATLYAEVRGRLTFYENGKPAVCKRPGKSFGKSQSAQFPCTLAYFGPNPMHFQAVMNAEGFARVCSVLK